MHRRGISLLEVTLVLVITGLVGGIAVPPALRLRDRWRARQAARDVVGVLAAARWRAQAAGRAVTVRFDTADGRLTATQGGWRIHRAVAVTHGARLAANRLELTYRADGLAAGAANLTAILRVGTAAESVRVSRLGRVR